MSQDEERALIALVQAGGQAGRDAAEKLFLAHDRAIWKVAMKTTSIWQTKTELHDEGVKYFLESIFSYDLTHPDQVRLSTWVYHHLQRRMWTYARRARLIPLPNQSVAVDKEKYDRAAYGIITANEDNRMFWERPDESAGADQTRAAEIAEDRAIARKLLKKCPPRWAQVLRMRYIEGMILSEIAERLGICKERVRQIAVESRAWIRKQYPELGEGKWTRRRSS